MQALGAFFLWYPLFGLPVVVGGLLVWLFARKHIQLRSTDWLLFLVPWVVWFGLTAAHSTGKSLSNLVEAFALGCITVVLFLARSVLTMAQPRREARWAVATFTGSCLAAVALWALVPGLPE